MSLNDIFLLITLIISIGFFIYSYSKNPAICIMCKKKLNIFEFFIKLLSEKRCYSCSEKLNNFIQNSVIEIKKFFEKNNDFIILENEIYSRLEDLKCPKNLKEPLIKKLIYYKELSKIKLGDIPVINVDIILDSDEYAHFNIFSNYYKQNKYIKVINGRLIGTNKRLYFISSIGSGSMRINWDNICKIDEDLIFFNNQKIKGLKLTVSKGSGGGIYSVFDTLYIKVMLESLVRLWKRQLVIFKEEKTIGPIPQHIKNAVFKRDAGKCIQCGYIGEYIEYDHIIPRSKGGNNSINNIQLLCRRCNLLKSNKI